MGNCFKKPSATERLLQLDKNYNNEPGLGSLYDDSIYDMSYGAHPKAKAKATKAKQRGPRTPSHR